MKLINHTIKQEIKKLARTSDSNEQRFKYLRLDKNERLLPLNKKALKQFKLSISENDLMGYANIQDTYQKLAKFLRVNVNQLLITAGSDLAIKSVFETFVSNKDSIIIQSPSYAMTGVYGKMFGSRIKYFKVNKDLTVSTKDIYDQIDRRTKLVVIENPNGFVGNMFKKHDIEQIAKKLKFKNIFLLIDEVYFYVENNFFDKKNFFKKYPNVIISQSFSKGHGLAGLRFGYLISNAKIMHYLKKVRPIHEVSSLSAKAANWVMNNPQIQKQFRKSQIQSKHYLEKQLSLLKIEYKMTTGNFFLIFAPNSGKTKNLSKKLKEKRILIRRPFEQKNIKGWLRICVGSLNDCRKLISTLKFILIR
tara:strand:+ start:1813 stop:2898 length:1086 start_codon:yes stop_codon:yes gene_type:complete